MLDRLFPLLLNDLWFGLIDKLGIGELFLERAISSVIFAISFVNRARSSSRSRRSSIGR